MPRGAPLEVFVGERYGMGVVIGFCRMPITPGQARQGRKIGDPGVILRCDCGNEYQSNRSKIMIGHRISCGCRGIKPIKVGDRFGKGVVTAVEDKMWATLTCDCGREFSARQDNLRANHTKSCGCLYPGRFGRADVLHHHARSVSTA